LHDLKEVPPRIEELIIIYRDLTCSKHCYGFNEYESLSSESWKLRIFEYVQVVFIIFVNINEAEDLIIMSH